MVAEKPVALVPEITVTSIEGDIKVTTPTSAGNKDNQQPTNDKKPEEKQGITRKPPQVNSAGKWRSYTSDGNSSRPVSRKRRASRSKRAHNRSGDIRHDSRMLTGEDHSDDDRSAGSGSDSEDLEMMMLRKKALLSMLKASQTRKTKNNAESDRTEVQESENQKPEAQQNSLEPPTDMLAVEQISDTESSASPVAHSIAGSDVVMVSLGPDNVVTFPSQFNSTTAQSRNVQNNSSIPGAPHLATVEGTGAPDLAAVKCADDPDLSAVKQVKGGDDKKRGEVKHDSEKQDSGTPDNVQQDSGTPQNVKQDDVKQDGINVVPPEMGLTQEILVGPSNAYYKVLTAVH